MIQTTSVFMGLLTWTHQLKYNFIFSYKLIIFSIISQHLFGISTKFFQYSKPQNLLSDHHLCQVAPELQTRSILLYLNIHFDEKNMLKSTKLIKAS